MSILNKFFGKPLSLKARKSQELSIWTGIPALGLDSLASTTYGPEAALMILLPLGLVGLKYFLGIMSLVVVTLLALYLSYQQTARAYPQGGGAYMVASDNLGKKMGVWTAAALLLDYLLNVAVGISAGVGAIVSAVPALHAHTLLLCLLVLGMLTFLNLRGIRESGMVFIFPTLIFILCIGTVILIGLFESLQSGGHPELVIPPPPPPATTAHLSFWLLLAAFANGLTAMTGVEAVSNAVPLFQKPRVRNAQWTLTIIVGVLALFLLFIGYLCPIYHIVAMDEHHPGYQTIYSQLIGAVIGKGIFYYVSITAIFIVLTYSAQTSFAGFPRVCRFLAEDHFLPHFFAERGRRLVFTLGIICLAFFSAMLLIVFKGITNSLIPLFAMGAFTAFLFSQIGMMVHWLHRRDEKRAKLKLFFNAFGASTTFIALICIIVTKFMEGAWVIVLLAPLLVMMMMGIRRHYHRLNREIEHPIEPKLANWRSPAVIIPIQGWNRVSERALRFGLLLSDDVTALYVHVTPDDLEKLKKNWAEHVEKPIKKLDVPMPSLEIVNSPYRQIYKPILSYINKIKHEKKDKLIAVVIPELVEAHWYEHLLHNIHASGLRAMLFLERDQRTVVITIPWYSKE